MTSAAATVDAMMWKGVLATADRFRRSPLSTLEPHKREPSVFVSAHPISGNTWISFLLSYCLNCPHFDVDAAEESPFNQAVQRYVRGSNPHTPSRLYTRVLKTHAVPSQIPLTRQDAVVCIVRDVRDVANSYYHRVSRWWPRSDSALRRNLARLLNTPILARPSYEFLVRYFALCWRAHMEDALATDVSLVHYESMLTDPASTLADLLRSLEPPGVEFGVVETALRLFSKDAMRKSASSVHQHHPIRTAGSGDWRNRFTGGTRRWFAQHVGDVANRLGYSLLECTVPDKRRRGGVFKEQ